LFGPGQGCTCGPSFWNLLYTLIADSFDPKFQALRFYSVCRSIAVAIFGSSFVDDTGLSTTLIATVMLKPKTYSTKKFSYNKYATDLFKKGMKPQRKCVSKSHYMQIRRILKRRASLPKRGAWKSSGTLLRWPLKRRF
jgi:hypothetical protein